MENIKNHSTNNYEFDERNSFSQLGVAIVAKYLSTIKSISKIIDVQNTTEGRRDDIDLKFLQNGNWRSAEVKREGYLYTGNFCFETISNEAKGTLGCFLKTKCDLFCSCFIDEKKFEMMKIFILKMPEVKNWFVKVKDVSKFRECKCNTKINEKYSYTTVFRLVPRQLVFQECPKYIKEINFPAIWIKQ